VLVASLRGLRSRGYGDAYMSALDPQHRHAIEAVHAATWLPVDVAMAHYAACDSLGLARATIESIGAESGLFVNQTVLTVVSKVSRGSGVTPWFALAQSNTLRERTWKHSSMAVWKLGPKEARLEWQQQPCARYAYFRTAFAAFAQAILALFAMTVYVREEKTKDGSLAYRISWV
jgi:hypothetical protein